MNGTRSLIIGALIAGVALGGIRPVLATSHHRSRGTHLSPGAFDGRPIVLVGDIALVSETSDSGAIGTTYPLHFTGPLVPALRAAFNVEAEVTGRFDEHRRFLVTRIRLADAPHTRELYTGKVTLSHEVYPCLGWFGIGDQTIRAIGPLAAALHASGGLDLTIEGVSDEEGLFLVTSIELPFEEMKPWHEHGYE